MLGLELQTSGNGLGVGWKTTVKPKGTLVSSTTDQRVDEKEVRLAGCNQPSAVRSDIYPKDRISQSGKRGLKVVSKRASYREARSHLGVLADRVKQSDITLV